MEIDSKYPPEPISPFYETNIETKISFYSFVKGVIHGCFTPEKRIEYQAKNLLERLGGDFYEFDKRRIKEKVSTCTLPNKEPKILEKKLIYRTLFYKERQ